MHRWISVALPVLVIAAGLTQGVAGAVETAGEDQPWVSYRNGRLVYRSDAQGNRIPDFSRAGYGGGGVPIPFAPVREIVRPSGTADDTAAIQTAIDAVAARPLDPNGFRGAVQLVPGNYQVAGTLTISASGVVLRGAGSRTNLVGRGPAHTLVRVGGTGTMTQDGPAHAITDTYVPVGARRFTVSDAAGLAAGDRVIVQRPFTTEWIHAIGMDNIPPRPEGTPSTPWPAGPGLLFDRQITSVQGNLITVDVPLTNALEQEYAASTVWKYSFPERIKRSGIEHLSADGAEFATDPDYKYFDSVLVNLGAIEDGWVRGVTAAHFGQPYITGGQSLRTTMTDVHAPDIAVPQTINAQPAAWQISGQQALVENCTVSGSNYHAWITQARVPGPNVYRNCSAANTGSRKLDAGPHQRWATGVLYDNVRMDSTGALLVVNRTWQGSGQGWAAANSVIWNCEVGNYRIDSPPTARNWAIGCTGRHDITPDQPVGTVQSHGEHVMPQSLYSAQLLDRLIP